MFRVSRLLVAAALTLAVAAPASAASALAPFLSVPGLINTGSLGTFIACTNYDAVPVSIGIDVFAQAGTQLVTASSNAVSLSPEATVLFGTQTAGGVTVDAALNPGTVTKGSATVETSSKKVGCSAYLADPFGVPPASMTTLTIVAKGKQKGD